MLNEEELRQLVVKVAKEELGEDEYTRQQSLEILRDWILKHPDIRDCRTDDAFLLRFLRHRKYSIPQTQDMIIGYIKVTWTIIGKITGDLDVLTPGCQEIINSGFVVSSPYRDRQGRAVFITIPSTLDVKKHDWKSCIKSARHVLALLSEDDITQVTGIHQVYDLTDLDPAFVTFIPLTALQIMFQNYETSTPLRIKKIHFIHPSSAGLWVFNLVKGFMSKKLQERIRVHKTLEDLHKELDPQVLPKELGGDMPIASMIELMKDKLKEKHEAISGASNMRLVGESYNVKEDIDDICGISGSYKKLNID